MRKMRSNPDGVLHGKSNPTPQSCARSTWLFDIGLLRSGPTRCVVAPASSAVPATRRSQRMVQRSEGRVVSAGHQMVGAGNGLVCG